jgi:NAD(P)-dependent dehydrogenase (short-subunit alcohol dehydrogenase family)
MPDKRIALVTGANQGVGLQVAKELVANGVTVVVGSRNFERGASVRAAGPSMAPRRLVFARVGDWSGSFLASSWPRDRSWASVFGFMGCRRDSFGRRSESDSLFANCPSIKRGQRLS